MILKKKPRCVSAAFDVHSLPCLTIDNIREFCCGSYPIDLSERYLEYSKDNESLRFMVATNKVPRGKTLIRVYGVRSRFRNSVNRRVEILFSKDSVVDTICTCPAGKRSMGCAHAVAILRYIVEEQSGKPSLPKSYTSQLKDLIKIPAEILSDSENESDSDFESKSE